MLSRTLVRATRLIQTRTLSFTPRCLDVKAEIKPLDESIFPGESTQYELDHFKGLSAEPFAEQTTTILTAPLNPTDIEITPDGKIYLPEIKYRRILIRAFGPGGWALIPRGTHSINSRNISREYALFCQGRFVGQARGVQDYFGEDGLPMASEGAKSNALMRCCKDLGIASELWDPSFMRSFKDEFCTQVWVTQGSNPAKKKLWRRKDRKFDYPYQEATDFAASATPKPAYSGYARKPYSSS